MITIPLQLSAADRSELESRARSQVMRAGDVRKAQLILKLAAGLTWTEIQQTLPCSPAFIQRWKKRFETEGMEGLCSRHRGSTASVLTPELEARILNKTRRPPSDGSTQWSTRKLARHLKINHMHVARTWQRANLKPHRMERYMMSNDPDFETKAADVIGLYLNPPQHAAIFCVDEKTAIQALDRKDPVLPFSPGRSERHGFEYKRNGTLSLYAAFDVRSGTVLGKTAKRHTSDEFVKFLTEVVESQPAGKEIHMIVDNLSAHKTKRVSEFLGAHPTVTLHYTPTYSSWLNQVELWFAKIERDVIARGVFTSVTDLKRKLMHYIKKYNETPKPVKWTYNQPTRRISTDTIGLSVTGH